MKKLLIVASLGLATLGTGLSVHAQAAGQPVVSRSAPEELKAFKEAIQRLYALKEKAFAERDADTIVDRFYSEDVISTGEGEPVFVGRAAIRPMYKQVVQESDVKVESVLTHVKGDMGWDWANFHVTPRDAAKKPFTFKILFLWERIGGKWICTGDMFLTGDMHDLQH